MKEHYKIIVKNGFIYMLDDGLLIRKKDILAVDIIDSADLYCIKFYLNNGTELKTFGDYRFATAQDVLKQIQEILGSNKG